MTHNERDAAFYQAHKDDTELWGEPEEPATTKRRAGLSATITVRFSAEEAEAIRRMAQEAKLTYSDVVRRAVRALTQPRFTIQDGVVYQAIATPAARRAAETVVTTTITNRQESTVTSTSSVPISEPR